MKIDNDIYTSLNLINEFDNDIYNNLSQSDAIKKIKGKKIADENKIYRSSNENLNKILTQYDFNNKDVLTVLSSSDQLFSSYYLGAKNVDSFDINPLTYYYYFLRKWTLLSTNKYYIPANNEELLNIIESHRDTKEELLAYKYWYEILTNITNSLYYSGLFYKDTLNRNLPYLEDLNKLIKIIKNKTPNFKHLNIFKDINTNKQYDIIIMSNILEYLLILKEVDSNIVSNNLNKLLKDDGIIISSNIINNGTNYIIKNNFIYEDSKIIEEGYFKSYPVNYVLRKKK